MGVTECSVYRSVHNHPLARPQIFGRARPTQSPPRHHNDYTINASPYAAWCYVASRSSCVQVERLDERICRGFRDSEGAPERPRLEPGPPRPDHEERLVPGPPVDNNFYSGVPMSTYPPFTTAVLRRALVRLVNQAELTDDFAESEHSTLRSAVKQARFALDYLDAIAKAQGAPHPSAILTTSPPFSA